MLDYSIIRDYFKNADRVKTEHLVLAEWNMNKYIPIQQYGVYRGYPSGTGSFAPSKVWTPNDPGILGGENYLVYDDGTKTVDPSQEYFSDLASVFKPERPDPGIVLLQKFGNMTFATTASALKTALISTNRARYYPVSENRPYDYFNSAKLMDLIPVPAGEQDFDRYSDAAYGISDSRTGRIANANPFVVYESASGVACNKITIKVQNHLAVPHKFEVETLVSGSWQTAYPLASSSSADWNKGILNLYFNAGSWSKTSSYVDDLNQIAAVNPTELKRINGIRLKVDQMTLVKSNESGTILSPASLELIEISPRLQINLSDYVESFTFASSIGDSTNFGLPVGSIVSGTGTVVLSNEEEQFLISSILGSLKMLNQDVKFNFYQKVTLENNQTYTVPMKVLYSNEWTVGQDYSVSVSLEDGMKFLRETNAPDILFSSNVPMSTLILLLLDNIGVTGLEFKKSSDAAIYDKEDIRIRNFFCKKEQTMAEVLEQIAIATQCSMFYDASDRLNVLTKERLSENAAITQSIGPSASVQQTDFWFIGNEDFSVSDPEYPYTSSYTANIASISEQKISPVTDGDIVYHAYGPKKEPLLQSIRADKEKSNVLDKLKIDEVPLASLAFSNYGYASTILWEPPQDNSSVLGAANVNQDIPAVSASSVFTASYTAFDEDDLVRQLYVASNSSQENRKSLVLYIDINEGITITPYDGIVLIDNEYIKYRGKLFYVASTNPLFSGYRIIFNENEFSQLQSSIRKGDSISFRGLIVEIRTKIIGQSDNKYIYKVIGDGRGHYSSKISPHFALAEDSDGIEENKQFKLMLGASKSESINMPGSIKATTKFNFLDKIRYKSGKKLLGTIPQDALNSYLGFLHLSGPTSPKEDTDILLSILDSKKSKTVPERLKKMNEQVDEAVPGNFDDYIYMQGERNIYGQKITLDFEPNAISTRMRLYSPRRLIRNNQEIMSTNSSIAGIGFGINSNNEGYFLEVESAGSGKNFVKQKEAWRNNLRFYKVQLKAQKDGKNVYEPKLLLAESVGAFTVFDTSVEVIKNDGVELDPVFDMDILIKKYANGIQYTIFYGGTKIGTYVEPIGEAIGVDSNNICLFVRNDSQAIFEYVMAAARPYGGVVTNNNEKDYFRNYKHFNRQLEKGIIPVGKTFVFKDNNLGIQFYFNDFARLAREVKEYDIRFAAPAFTSALLDISKINPKYFVKSYRPTAFGAKLTLVNSSGSAISLGETDKLPIFIVGIAAQEINSGTVTMKDIYDATQDDKRRQTDREKNIAIYGSQAFTLDSQYIQSLSQAKNLMRWITRYCGRERIKLSLEVFSNPLIELGDKVRVFDKSRGYNQSNPRYGSKTFVVSSISHSVSSNGPSMTVDLVEVGEA